MSDEVDNNLEAPPPPHDQEILSCINAFNGNYDEFISRVEDLWKHKKDKAYKPGEILEVTAHESEINVRIGSLISSGTVLDLSELYTLILNNLSIASHDEIRVLLSAMKLPKKSDNAKIVRSLAVHKAFSDQITGNTDTNYSKEIIVNWLESLATIGDNHPLITLNSREAELRDEYIEAKESYCRASDESERYKSIYDKISKLMPKDNPKMDRARTLRSFLPHN